MNIKKIGQAALLMAMLNLGACAAPSETAESVASSPETGITL